MGRYPENQQSDHVGAHEAFMVPAPKLRFDMGYDSRCRYSLDDDGSLHDLAVIHHQLALTIVKQHGRPTTESSEGNSPGDWMKQGTCLTSSLGMERQVCGTGNCLNKVREQHCQLAQLYGRLSMSRKKDRWN